MFADLIRYRIKKMPKTKVSIPKPSKKQKEGGARSQSPQTNARSRTLTPTARRGKSSNVRQSFRSPETRSASRGQSRTREESKHESRLGSQAERFDRRYRAPESALKQIRQFKKKPTMMIRRAPFQRLVRDITRSIGREEASLR